MKKILLVALILLTSNVSMAGSKYVTASITAQNTFSDIAVLGHSANGVLTLSGTWSATVTVQRKDTLGTWRDVTDNTGTAIALTANGTYTIYEPNNNAEYRFGVKTSGYTSGTVVGTLEWN